MSASENFCGAAPITQRAYRFDGGAADPLAM